MEPPMTFVELMQIEELKSEDGNGEIRNTGERRFMSLQPAYEPGNGTSYGGHVFAQAVWAASGTVEEGLVAHVSSVLIDTIFYARLTNAECTRLFHPPGSAR